VSSRRGHLRPLLLRSSWAAGAWVKPLATEAITKCVRSGGVGEAESNMELLDLVSIPAASDWDASVTVERINL
jgi:hypothetical protein